MRVGLGYVTDLIVFAVNEDELLGLGRNDSVLIGHAPVSPSVISVR